MRSFLVLLAACGSHADRAGDAAVAPPPPVTADAAHAPIAIDAAPGTPGAVHVTVQWKDAPTEMRASPGRDGCGDARPAFARVHTLFGVADVVVTIDGATAAAPTDPVTVAIRHCHLEPAVQIGGAELRVANLAEAPADAEIAWSATLADPPATTIARFPLPVIGTTVALPTKPTVFSITTSVTADPAWVVIGPAELTDETGAASFANVPPGDHVVTAWLHPGAGAPAKLVTGTVTVKPGDTADVTLSFGGAATPDAPGPDVDPAP